MRRRNIVIELTSLLDVIMIILFMVLVSAQSSAQSTESELQQALDSAEQTIAEAEEAKQRAEDIAGSYDMIDENCGIITVSITGTRKALVTCGDFEETIAIEWDNDNYVKNSLNLALTKCLSSSFEEGSQAAFVMLRYDSGAIYNSDYRLIRGIIKDNLGANIYLAEYDTAQEAIK